MKKNYSVAKLNSLKKLAMAEFKQQKGAASVKDVMQTINNVIKETGYSCKTVSWDDASRSHSKDGLSCIGSNYTDTYLEGDEKKFFIVRPDNWNEKLGLISTDNVSVLRGNSEGFESLEPRTLTDVLTDFGKIGKYVGINPKSNLYKFDKVSIRFQTTFIPVEKSESNRFASERVVTKSYNYKTYRNDDPKNMMFVCNTQGISVHQSMASKQILFHHSIYPDTDIYYNNWLDVESSNYDVGKAQNESEEDRKDAMSRGKAIAACIGIPAMGTRFNVMATIQIPIEQKPRPPPTPAGNYRGGATRGGGYSGATRGGGYSGATRGGE